MTHSAQPSTAVPPTPSTSAQAPSGTRPCPTPATSPSTLRLAPPLLSSPLTATISTPPPSPSQPPTQPTSPPSACWPMTPPRSSSTTHSSSRQPDPWDRAIPMPNAPTQESTVLPPLPSTSPVFRQD